MTAVYPLSILLRALWDDSLACSGDRVFAGFNYLTQRDLIGCYSGNRFNSYDINPNNNTLTGSVLIDEENMLASYMDILGADEDNLYIVCTSNDTGLVLYTIDILDASYTRTVLSDEISLYDGGISYSDGYLCYVISVDDRPVIAIRPAAGCSVELFDVPEEVSFDSMQTPSFFPESSYIYLPSVYSDYIINTETGECTEVEIPDNWNGTRIIRYDQLLGEFGVYDLMNVLFVTPDSGDVYYSVDNTGIMITGLDLVTIGDDYLLLVAYNGGSLIRYNAYTGEYVGNSDLTNSTAYDFTEFDLDEDAGVLYVQQDRLISIVDINDWVETSAILNSIGHHSPTDRFYTLSYENADGIHVGYFRHYSPEELIARANNMLGGVPVPDDLVRRYGL